MELFKIVAMNCSERVVCSLFDSLGKKLQEIDMHPSILTLDLHTYPTHTMMRGHVDQPVIPIKKQLFYEQLSQTVADYIVNQQESELVRNMIEHHPQLRHQQEMEQVYRYAMNSLLDEFDSEYPQLFCPSHRKHQIMCDTAAYFQENLTLNLEGYILFRLKQYVDDIAMVVEHAIDEYKLEKQYQEFIMLLKYFVYIQDAKISFVHVIHKDQHEFEIVDEQLQAIHFLKKDSLCKLEMIDHHVSVDDRLISSLVSVSPAHICIHSRSPHTPVVQMIVQIFEDRVNLCASCRICQPAVEDLNRVDQFFP